MEDKISVEVGKETNVSKLADYKGRKDFKNVSKESWDKFLNKFEDQKSS